MVQHRKAGLGKNFLTHFSPAMEIKFEFNWLRISSIWMFIVFGFFGWGTLPFSESNSIPSIFTAITLVLVFGIYFLASNRYGATLDENFIIKVKQIYVALGILSLLCVINKDWIFRSLTGDELAYAMQSQGHSFAITKKILSVIPQLDSLSFRLLLQFSSIILLGAFLLAMNLISRIKNLKGFILVCFFGTLLLRVAIMTLGGSSGANPPGASFFYLIGTTILSPSNASYRILSLLFASIFLTFIYQYLENISKLSKSIRILILLFVLSIPLFRHMSLLVEISVWYFYFATISLLVLLKSKGLISHQLIFVGALATSLRFPIVAILLSLYAAQFFFSPSLNARFGRPPSFIQSTLGLFPCIPGLIWIITTRFIEKYGVASTTNDFLDSQISTVEKSYHEILSTLAVTTSKISWFIAAVGLFLFMRGILINSVFVFILLFFEFLFFFVLNSGVVAYASKYIIEWFVPFIVFGVVVVGSKLKFSRASRNFFVASLITLVAVNLVDYKGIPAKFVKKSTLQASGQVDFNNMSRVVVSVPFSYRAAFNQLEKSQATRLCLNIGVVYGIYPQILEGYSARNVLILNDNHHKFLSAQEAISENWMTASAASIGKSGSNCVIVGFVNGQSRIIRDLLGNNWHIRARFFDEDYHTKVFILTR